MSRAPFNCVVYRPGDPPKIITSAMGSATPQRGGLDLRAIARNTVSRVAGPELDGCQVRVVSRDRTLIFDISLAPGGSALRLGEGWDPRAVQYEPPSDRSGPATGDLAQ